jgi:predicted transglutaminase-like cysteine proteinase
LPDRHPEIVAHDRLGNDESSSAGKRFLQAASGVQEMLNEDHKLILDKSSWKLLVAAQKAGNKVVWTEDQKTWGVPELWEFPKTVKGRKIEDCDGITLYKMNLLLDAGIDPEALSFVVCRDDTGEGHAVLCVITDQGDYILDNRQQEVCAYPHMVSMGYSFLYRSSPGMGLGQSWETIEDE